MKVSVTDTWICRKFHSLIQKEVTRTKKKRIERFLLLHMILKQVSLNDVQQGLHGLG